MDRDNLRGLSPLWLISLAMVLGTAIVVLIPASIASGDPIKSSDWIGFAGAVVAGTMTIIAAVVAWFAVQKQIAIQQEIADGQGAFQRFLILQQQLATLENDLRLTRNVNLHGWYTALVQSNFLAGSSVQPSQVDIAREELEERRLGLVAAEEEFALGSTQRWAFEWGIPTRADVQLKLSILMVAVAVARETLGEIPKGAAQISAQETANCLAISLKAEADKLDAACEAHCRIVRKETWRLGDVIIAMRIKAGL